MDTHDIYHSPSQNCTAWNRTLCAILAALNVVWLGVDAVAA